MASVVDASPASSPADAADASPDPALAELQVGPMPVVPVTSFWSTRDSIGRDAVLRALRTGSVKGFDRVVASGRALDALAAELDLEPHEDVRRMTVDRLGRVASRGALGILLADEVTPRVRALEMDGRSLFGNGRVKDARRWPLTVPVETEPGRGWSQPATWVLVAGGDSFTDRGVYRSVVTQGRGVDYPFAGGTARVTGHGCCDPVFNDNIVPRYVLTGNRGEVRRLFRSADLAIANHEAPTTEAWAFHSSGTRFSGKPELTRMFTRAGIDWVSLANNHIKDYGTSGIKDTRRIMREAGIGFGGAGKDLEQARKISYLKAGDTSVAIIPCVGVAPSSWAGPRTSGGTPCLDRYLVPDVRKASRKADVVIVFPHWGVEYTRQPVRSMRKHAAKWVRAGADLVLGAHSHVAGAIEDVDGTPVLYSLGNLIFDQHWSTNTMESVLLEATFHGGRLVQLRLRPYIIHNQSQPNLLDPAKGEGRRLIKQIRSASKSWLDW